MPSNYEKSPQSIVLLDRDGTINVGPPKGCYVGRLEDFIFIPEALAGIQKLAAAGFSFAIISNQAGLASGVVTVETLKQIDEVISKEFSKLGAELLKIYYCGVPSSQKTHPDRKPQPGMFFKFAQEFSINLNNLFYVGDDIRDMQAAWNAKCLGAFIGKTAALTSLPKEQQPYMVGKNLEQIADQIITYYSLNKSPI